MEIGFLATVIICIWCSLFGIHAETLRYINKVTHICPDDAEGVAEITALTDLIDTVPYALCKDNGVFRFTPENIATWKLNASFGGDPKSKCVLNQKDDSSTFVINVYIPMTGGVLINREMPHVVTCTYEPHTERESKPAEFADSKRPLKGIIRNAGTESKTQIDLFLTDVRGTKLTGRISLGRLVRLQANLIGEDPKEVSLQALECRARGKITDYSILIGGCGDGVVIEKDVGFITNGRVSKSPMFKTFRLMATQRLTFSCTFIMCESNCDGNSCSLQGANTNQVNASDIVI